MTFDPEKPCQTRDGRQVRIFDIAVKNDTQAIAGVIIQTDGHENLFGWMGNGRLFDHADTHPGGVPGDLINIPEEHEVHVVLGRNSEGKLFVIQPPSCKPRYVAGAIASKRITFTEGEFEK